MSELIAVHWTAGSLDEARKICRYLVQERLVASAQIIPWTETISLWNNQLDTSQESQIILKTRRENFDEVQNVILKNSRYQIPEITYTVIPGGHAEYLKWIEESTPSGFETSQVTK
jgi:periplasmic divalent cation tolerance protein